MHQKLRDVGATLSYQALTAFCRRHCIGHEPVKPAGQYHFGPGEEMQHDTSELFLNAAALAGDWAACPSSWDEPPFGNRAPGGRLVLEVTPIP